MRRAPARNGHSLDSVPSPSPVYAFAGTPSRRLLTRPVPAERTNPSGNTIVTLAEQSDEKPAALLKWFYPGRTTGHEFIYPKQEKQQLAQSRQETIVLKGAAQTVD
jgi:hypothetical protein